MSQQVPYRKVSILNELGDTYNQYIVKHTKVSNGVFVTQYEGGKQVVVNYNYNDYNFNGTKIPKRDFVVMGGGQ